MVHQIEFLSSFGKQCSQSRKRQPFVSKLREISCQTASRCYKKAVQQQKAVLAEILVLSRRKNQLKRVIILQKQQERVH